MSTVSIFTKCINPGTKYEIHATAIPCGNDWSVTVVGGTLHHIGGIAICHFDNLLQNISTLSLPEHKDELAARLFATTISNELHCTVCVNAGIHIDNATKEEIAFLMTSCEQCCHQLLKDIKKQG